MCRIIFLIVSSCVWASTFATAEPEPAKKEAEKALRQGVEYFRSQVSIEGGYLWRYAADFSEREGEIPASPTTAWVQPPGTPSVGIAYLRVYEYTRDRYYLEAAQETAHALVKGQLESGGWDYRINFSTKDRIRYAYRVDAAHRTAGTSQRNVSTLDDNTTQAALRLLMRTDKALGFKDKSIHEAVEYALQSLIDAQYPNGAWPQRFSAPPDPEKFPVKPASYPENWPKSYPQKSYSNFYTFNDNTMGDTIEVMFMAGEVYSDERYTDAGKRGGDFMILAQMPEPQPGWAQQYNAEMHPAWARKFEPASITGGESQGVMNTLLRVYEYTGDPKYLEPIPRALAYYKKSVLEDGRLARFYELHTNRPLYFTKDYTVTYSDADMPTHYGFKTGNRLDAIEAKYNQLTAIPQSDWRPRKILRAQQTPRSSTSLSEKTMTILHAQNDQGAWVEPAFARARSDIPTGVPSLTTRTFISNITTLAQFIAAESP